MIKLKWLFWFIQGLFFIGLCGCAKDEGNYDYQEVNVLTVTDEEGLPFGVKSFGVDINDSFSIQAKVRGSLSGTDLSQVDFYWIIDGDTLSRDSILTVESKYLGIGVHGVNLSIVDRQTALSYHVHFWVRIVGNSIFVSYLLTTDENGESTIVSVDGTRPNEYLYLQYFGGFKVGNKPIGLQSVSGLFTNLMVITEEGEVPLFTFNTGDFTVMDLYFSQSSVVSGEFFQPTFWSILPSAINTSGVILMDGKCRLISNGHVGLPIYRKDPLDYDFGRRGVLQRQLWAGKDFIVGFDQRNERIRVFGNVLNLLGNGIRNYDAYFDPRLTVGHRFLAVREASSSAIQWQFLTYKGSEVFLHNIVMGQSIDGLVPQEVGVLTHKAVPEMIDAVDFKFLDGYWYFAKGRKVYRCAENTLDVEVYFSLPDDGSGDVVSWDFSAFESEDGSARLVGIATYNSTVEFTNKGSYYIYNPNDERFERQDLYKIQKAVDVLLLQ